ncbi:hypothetical protein JTB14_012977 [Gonioctena quinquepunctata]|nr:hypothetical protein JTB14_012977 [Gonioctena quinquepunctata]
MMRYDSQIIYTPRKNPYIANILSRKSIPSEDDDELKEEVDAYIHAVTLGGIHTSDDDIITVANSQSEDPLCKEIQQVDNQKWPNEYELSIDGILLRGDRLMIPSELCTILEKFHVGHQGITKNRRPAQRKMWWPGISNDIESRRQICPICIQHSSNHNEPLIPVKSSDYPWQKWYLVITDQHSRFLEIGRVHRIRSFEIIEFSKSVFAKHSIPQIVCSDSGTKFPSTGTSEFQPSAKQWGFPISAGSPQFHQVNRAAEAAMKVAKNIIGKNKSNVEMALFRYRNTPLENGFVQQKCCMAGETETIHHAAVMLHLR